LISHVSSCYKFISIPVWILIDTSLPANGPWPYDDWPYDDWPYDYDNNHWQC